MIRTVDRLAQTKTVSQILGHFEVVDFLEVEKPMTEAPTGLSRMTTGVQIKMSMVKGENFEKHPHQCN